MLSLLSLLLASGTVLRPDTEEWTPLSYPDPRTNYTECNTWSNSTLCDPDHILTEQWREQINRNLQSLMESELLVYQQTVVQELREATMEYTENAPFQCYDNTTNTLQLYVILAKRIQSAKNHTITETDLTKFGDGLVEQFGLKDSECRNFMIFIGVEAAKMAYVRTGSDLKLPTDLMEHIFNKYNLFKAKNFMEVLNKIVNEIGERIMEKPDGDMAAMNETLSLMNEVSVNSSVAYDAPADFNTTFMSQMVETTSLENDSPSWHLVLFLVISIIVLLVVLIVVLLFNQRVLSQLKHLHRAQHLTSARTETTMASVDSMEAPDEKPSPKSDYQSL